MSLIENDNKDMRKVQELIEERVKYFLKYQPQTQNNIKEKNLNRIKNYDNFSTLIDPINSKNDNINPIFINNFNLTQNINNTNINNIINNISPNQIINRENINDSISFGQNNNSSEIPLKKSISFPVSKEELAQYMEPRLERKVFQKISPKFAILNTNNDKSTNTNKSSTHRYTKSELEILETDEKIPQNKINEITGDNKLENNNNDIKTENDNLLIIFHFLISIEKCYQELSKDLKGNGLKNIEYKLKIACNYLNLITEEKNLISDFFYNKEDDINTFLIRELCLYLILLFLDTFVQKLNDNNIKEFQTCQNYCHINLIYLIMITIKKIDISENKLELDKNSIEFNDYQNCKIIVEINSNKINANKYKENFHTNNKIIKNILLNILNNFSEINKDITQNIFEIYNLSKKSKYKTILNEHIKNNFLINEKINNIIKKYHSPENKEEIKTNENIIKEEIPVPYLSPKKKDDKRDYCLVLDLDETLVHFFEDNSEAYVKVRMGAEQFITVLSQYCEIVIFTASTQYYADIVIDGLDCKNLIDYKLYREHTIEFNGNNVKDLSKLGRDLNKVIIIDNIEENYCFQPNNGLNIIDFEGDENDNELQFLLEDLLEVVTIPGKNIINELPKIRKNMQKRYCNID